MRYATDTGFYELHSFPGSNQIVISNHAFVHPEHRGKGAGKRTNEERIQQARGLGYDYMICTVRADNVPQLRIMQANGWRELDRFVSTETEVEVIIFGHSL